MRKLIKIREVLLLVATRLGLDEQRDLYKVDDVFCLCILYGHTTS